jgi:hypothetical protein
MNDIQESSCVNHLDLLERGIVNASSTTISLLGLDLIGIRQVKVTTTIDTWLKCAEFL